MKAPARRSPYESGVLDLGNVLRVETLGASYYLELDLVAFVQRPETLGLNCRLMHKHIAASLSTYEPITLLIVKPFHNALFSHFLSEMPPG
jgi:hypothetical protein